VPATGAQPSVAAQLASRDVLENSVGKNISRLIATVCSLLTYFPAQFSLVGRERSILLVERMRSENVL
jgi:hypothetical protein